MTTDELLKAVAQAARDDEVEDDPRWSALVEGKLPEQDRAALEELAKNSPRHEEAWHMLRPLDEQARARFTDGILAQMQGEKAGAEESRSPAPPREGAQVIPLPKRRTWRPVIAVALAAAAAVALFVGLRGLPSTDDNGPIALLSSQDPVPAYELTLLGGERSTRTEPIPAEPRPTVRLGSGSSLEIVLRPATSDRKPITTGGFLIQDGRARVWEVQPEISPDGAIQITGDRQALFPNVPAGSYELVIAVGRPGALPDADAVVRGAAGERDARVRQFRQSIVLVDP
ncbi:hypothetical protein [Polyangium mundeleinium]|uniref:Anti-sigma factor n=1 Tax=Polyangium mundeleinium TaxID=2995306 RepID=A0ABT5F378_9BACT|nr:hypothetical protein [Polyangium mundeleinium]MDC0747937.1 hypothetical protein [Polyangium mundeleinium]